MVSVWCFVGGGCVCGGGVFVCVCLAYASEDFHMKTHRYTEDSTRSEDPKTGPRKTLAKNAKNVMFYHLRGVRAPRTLTDFQPYLIYEDIRVLGSISKASGGVCVWGVVCEREREGDFGLDLRSRTIRTVWSWTTNNIEEYSEYAPSMLFWKSYCSRSIGPYSKHAPGAGAVCISNGPETYIG